MKATLSSILSPIGASVLFVSAAVAEVEITAPGTAGTSARLSGQVQQWLEADIDGDGKLAASEVRGLMAKFFQRNDADRDGFLDVADLEDLSRRLADRGGATKGGTERPDRGGTAAVPAGVEFKADVAYREGNPMWKLDLAYPKEKSDALRPGLVIIHGGGWRSGDKGGGQWRSLPLEYVAKGYVCVSLNYRLTDEAPFPACVEDVKCAVRWLRAHASEFQLDPNRIGAYGNSAGAHLVSMLGLVGPAVGLEGDGPYRDFSSQVQAVCASATPTDFREWNVRGLLAGPEESLAERAAKASPVSYVNDQAPPFLLVHGTADTTVKFEQGKRLAKLLEEAGADVTLLTFEGAGHGVFGANAQETGPAMEAFFARTLGARAE